MTIGCSILIGACPAALWFLCFLEKEPHLAFGAEFDFASAAFGMRQFEL
jgi:hypothetical protein